MPESNEYFVWFEAVQIRRDADGLYCTLDERHVGLPADILHPSCRLRAGGTERVGMRLWWAVQHGLTNRPELRA